MTSALSLTSSPRMTYGSSRSVPAGNRQIRRTPRQIACGARTSRRPSASRSRLVISIYLRGCGGAQTQSSAAMAPIRRATLRVAAPGFAGPGLPQQHGAVELRGHVNQYLNGRMMDAIAALRASPQTRNGRQGPRIFFACAKALVAFLYGAPARRRADRRRGFAETRSGNEIPTRFRGARSSGCA